MPCLNKEYGCPHTLIRRAMAEHLPVCPASVVVCSAQWNRWALGAREREKVTFHRGATALYQAHDIGK